MTSDLKLEDKKIFVGGLHSCTTDECLGEYFKKFGEIEDASVMYDSLTKRSRGFGFVTFKDPQSVHVACLGQHTLNDKKIDPKRAYQKGAEATVQEEIHLTKVFIGGLPQEADVDSIAEFFSQFGPVTKVDLKIDKETGRMRGFGFVGFEKADFAKEAAKVSFRELNGKTIEVKPAEARKKKETPTVTAATYDATNYNTTYQRNIPPHDFQYGHHGYHPPSYQQQFYYGNSTAANYGQGPYSGYHQAAQQDYTYGRGASYGTQGASYGQQDYSYPRNFASEMPTTYQQQQQQQQQQQMTNYPPPPQDVGAATGFSQPRSTYTSNTDTYTGHPGYGGYATGGYEGYNYSSDQSAPTTTSYGRGTARGNSFGYGR